MQTASDERLLPATLSTRWAFRLCIGQGLCALAFFVVAQTTHRGGLLAFAYYIAMALGFAATIAGSVTAIRDRRASWLIASVFGLVVSIAVAIYAYSCCARWGS